MRLRGATIIALTLGLAGTGCGAGHSSHRQPTPASAVRAQKAATPQPVRLALELPLVGLSSAPSVSYATSAGNPTLRGQVTPAGATVYLLGPDGTRSAVIPR